MTPTCNWLIDWFFSPQMYHSWLFLTMAGPHSKPRFPEFFLRNGRTAKPGVCSWSWLCSVLIVDSLACVMLRCMIITCVFNWTLHTIDLFVPLGLTLLLRLKDQKRKEKVPSVLHDRKLRINSTHNLARHGFLIIHPLSDLNVPPSNVLCKQQRITTV